MPEKPTNIASNKRHFPTGYLHIETVVLLSFIRTKVVEPNISKHFIRD